MKQTPFGMLRKRGSALQEERRSLMNELDGVRQELFHLAERVHEALVSGDIRKLRAAAKAVDKLPEWLKPIDF